MSRKGNCWDNAVVESFFSSLKKERIKIRADHFRGATGLSVFELPDYRGWPGRRLHSPRAERMEVRPPSAPSAQSVQTKKKPPVDLAISP